jgi:hypothetical protein
MHWISGRVNIKWNCIYYDIIEACNMYGGKKVDCMVERMAQMRELYEN